jgi:hypothetical protein
MVRKGSIQPVSNELDLAGLERPFAADVSGKGDARPVLEGFLLATGFYRDSRVIVAFHAQHRYPLKIGTIWSARSDTPGLQLIGDICCRKPQSLGKRVSTLQLI